MTGTNAPLSSRSLNAPTDDHALSDVHPSPPTYGREQVWVAQRPRAE